MPDRDFVASWERLVRYHRATTAAMDRHLRTTFDRSLDDYDVLHQLGVSGDPMRMGELADRLLFADSSCNRIVGRLVEAGLVERRSDPSDGRVVLVSLTPTGNRLRRRMAAVHTRDIETRFSSPLTPTQAADLDTILRQLLTTAASETQ